MRSRCLTLIALLPSLIASAAEPASVAPFTLPDANGKPVAPLAAKEGKALVVAFVGTECPVNNGYMPRLAELHAKYGPNGVGFVAINSNQQDSPKAVAEHAK